MAMTSYLTAEEAAIYLGGGLNPRTLTRWAREEKIPAFAMGDGSRRIWRFRPADLDAWMESRRNAPQKIAA